MGLWNAILSELQWTGQWTAGAFPQWWPVEFQAQAANFHNVCLDPTLAGYYPELNPGDAQAVNEWLAVSWLQCMVNLPVTDPHWMHAYMTCPRGWDCTSWEPEFPWQGGTITFWQWNVMVMGCYVSTLVRIDRLWPGHADEVWIYFYYLYNTEYGRILVDQFIYDKNPPQPLIDALKNNFNPDYQRLYGILNMPDLNSALHYYEGYKFGCDAWALANGDCANMLDAALGTASYSSTGYDLNREGFFMHTIQDTGAFNRFGNPTWTPKQRKEAYDLLLSPKMIQSTAARNGYLKGYWDFYIGAGWFDPGNGNGPPHVVPPPDETRGKANPITDPAYQGNLPYAPAPVLPDQRLWHPDLTNPNATKQCIPHKGPIEKLVPIVGGVVGFVVGSIFMPGEASRLSGGVTLGSFGFFYLGNVYGWDAFQSAQWGVPQGRLASQILSGGLGITAALALYDLNLVPEVIDFGEAPVSLAVGAVSYTLLNPILDPVLSKVGSLANKLTLPLAILERAIGAFSDGCVDSYLRGDCLCSYAEMKSKLAPSILEDIYGVTGQQLVMRNKCMRTQMMQGMWGTDPEQIGTCDPVYHFQTNPAACLDSAVWTDENIPKDEDLTRGMFELIYPCLQADNPVFMPPRSIDAPCASQGPHFRMINGRCVDYGVDTSKF